MNATRTALLFAAALLAAAGGCTPASRENASPGSQAAGGPKELYALHCQVCHGAEGRGNGPAAEFLFPKPRDFSTATFKLRSTASGELPTDADLLRTLTRGLPGTAMPSFAHLPEGELRSLMEYLKGFAVVEAGGKKSTLFAQAREIKPLPVGAEPACTPALLARGRALYDKMQCGQCHGATGVGDGPSAHTLVDRWGWPNPPANFTNGVFKGGDTVADIYQRFTTGMNGTPMPTYEKNLADDERWALAHYVKSMLPPGRPSLAYDGLRPIVPAATAKVPSDPADPAWKEAAAALVPLMPLWQRTQASTHLSVRVLQSRDQIGFLLEWDDPSVNGSVLGMKDYSDAASIMFPLSDPPGPFTMGAKGQPVNLWQWRFSRQLDLAHFRDVESAHPGMAVDGYFYEKSSEARRRSFPGHGPIESAPSQDPAHLTAWAAGNSLANPVPPSAVEDLNAEGFGTLRPQPIPGQNVSGRGTWTAGRWQVAFIRSLEGGAGDASFAGRRPAAVSFGVWDGASGDRDGMKLVTPWLDLSR